MSGGSRQDRDQKGSAGLKTVHVCVCVSMGGGGAESRDRGRISEEGGRVGAKRAQGEVKERRG